MAEVSETYYRNIVENQTELICRYDADFRLKFANRAYCEWLGQPLDDLLQVNILERIPPDEREQAVAHVRSLTPDHPVAISAHRSIMPDGSRRWIEWTDLALFDTDGHLIEYQGVGRDITEQMRAKDALLESERRLKLFVEHAPAAIAMFDREMNYLSVSRRWLTDYRLKDENIVGRSHYDVFPDISERWKEIHRRCLQGAVEKSEADPFPRADGSLDWVRWEIHPWRDGTGEIGGIVLFSEVITERKEAEAALHTSEVQLRALVDSQTNYVIRVNLEGKYTYWNRKFEEEFGWVYEPQGILGGNALDSICEYHHERTRETVEKCLAEPGKVIKVEVDKPGRDGGVRTTLWEFVCLTDSAGRPAEMQSMGIEITDLKQAQAALEEANRLLEQRVVERTSELETATKRIEAIFNHSGDGILLLSIEDGIQQANHAFDALFGVPADSYFGKRLREFFNPEDAEQIGTIIQQAAAAHRKFHVEARARRADGTSVDVEISIAPVNRSEEAVTNLVCIIRDITDRKQAERALRDSEAMLKNVIENIPLRLFWKDRHSVYRGCNTLHAQSSGRESPDAVVGKTDFDFMPSEAVRWEADDRRVMESGQPIMAVEEFFVEGNGESRWLRSNKVPLRDSADSIIGVLVTVEDITQRKQAEQSLEKYVAEVHDLYNNAPAGYHSLDKNGLIVQINDTELRWLGYTREEVVGKLTFLEIITPASVATFQANFPTFKAQGWIEDLEFEFKRKDGSTFLALLSATAIYDETGQYSHSRSTLFDITERRRAQRATAEERNLLRTLINSVPDFIYVKDRQHRLMLANTALAKLVGYNEASEITGKTDFDFYPAEMAAGFHADEDRVFETGQPLHNLEERSIGRDGRKIWALTTKVPLRDLDGEIIGLVGMTRDISAIKANEIALRESEERYHSTIAAMAEGIVLQGQAGDIQLCNAAAERILGLTADQMMGRTSVDPRWRAIHEDGSPFPGETHPVVVSLRTGRPQSNVVMGVHKPDGALTWILINSQPLVEPGQPQPYAAVVTFADITERRNAEAALEEKRREEREMQSYLKALHHITLRLTRVETLDDFYRSTVELGLGYFGFERLGLALYDAKTNAVTGTYGTDAHGKLTDEHHVRLDPNDAPQTRLLSRVLDRAERFAFDEAAQLFDGLTSLGTGSQAVAALWNAELLGWLSVDNGIHHQPISRAQLDILALYALTVGSLLARKHAESALRESEERYRLLAENIRDVIVKTSPRGIRTFATPSCYELVGYRPEELVGRLGLDYVHPDDRLMTREIVDQAVSSGAAYFMLTQRIQHKAGHYVWVETTNTVVRDAATGEVVEFVGVAHDITERKQAEDALRASEERYRLLAENIRDVIVKTTPEGRLTFITSSCYDVIGYQPEELVGRDGGEIMHPDDRPIIWAKRRQALEQGTTSYVANYRILHKAGHYVWVEVSNTIVRDAITGKPTEVIGILHDITERKQAEDALRESEEKFRTFIESAPIAAFITDQTGTILLVNRELEKLFGYSRDELIGQPVQVLVPDESRKGHGQHVEDYMIAEHKRRSEAMELAARRKDGSVFPADIQLSFINLHPNPMVMSFVIDITQRKQAEQALQDALRQEKELGELKTRFVSMASHEFRTPLASILAVSETLVYYRHKMDEAQIDERLGRIRQQVMYMKDIMEDVLQLARIQAGRVEFKPSWGNLDRLCQEIIEEFDGQEAYRGRIMYTCASPQVTEFFDERLVRQIVSNLVSNALKYSDRPAYVYVGLAQDEAQVVFTVKDEGIGIPPDDIRHLYEPFHRATNVGTISGTGLGLSITRQAVELHGGTIALDTQVGAGSTVTVTFPRVSTEDGTHGQDHGD